MFLQYSVENASLLTVWYCLTILHTCWLPTLPLPWSVQWGQLLHTPGCSWRCFHSQTLSSESDYDTALSIFYNNFNFCDSSRCRILMLSKRQIFMPEIVSDIQVLVCALYKLFIITCKNDLDQYRLKDIYL